MDEIDDDINLEDPRDYMVEPLRDDFCFEEPYEGAKYNLVVPVDFSDQKLVPSETEHHINVLRAGRSGRCLR